MANEVDKDFMGINLAGDGKLNRMEVDYTNQVDELLPKADILLKAKKVAEAVDLLAPLEKQSRLGCDMKSNTRLVKHMVKLAFDGKDFDLLGETVRALCKKRSLIKFSIKSMVKDVCEMLEGINDNATKDRLIEVLRAVTAGKIYVEVERARLTKKVVDKLESEGKMDEARNMILELQIETFGSMEVKEKVQFLLHQMRLSIELNDYFRAGIISRKISVKFFEKEDNDIHQMKMEYYNYMIGIGLHEENYLDVCKYYMAVFRDPVNENAEFEKEILKRVVLYIVLSRHDNEQSDLMQRIKLIPQLDQIPEYKSLLAIFLKQEIIFWKNVILRDYGNFLRSEVGKAENGWKFMFQQVFGNDISGQKRFDLFHKCVGEHNVRMIAKYYTRISFDRMAKLLEFSIEEMETFVCKLIADGVIVGVKIHRPSRIINLRTRRQNLDILDDWGSNIRKLTDTLNKVSHLIIKEEMVHGSVHGIS